MRATENLNSEIKSVITTPTLSVIIPTLNEAENITQLLELIIKNTDNNSTEIIVSDGGSTDKTVSLAKQFPVKIIDAPAGRAGQMNAAASQAEGKILYFVHADTRPPISFEHDVQLAVEAGAEIGSYRLKIDGNHIGLRFLSFMSRFNRLVCRGGDQSLFITKSFFRQLNGFDGKMEIMEEYDLIKRASKEGSFHIFTKSIVSSSRKYQKNGFFRVQLAHALSFMMFNLGASSGRIKRLYSQIIN